ncbi:hypothetical protein M8R73_22475, partial [Enterobacter roggenkampii]
MLSPKPSQERCYVDPNGTLVVVDDGDFYHLLYDTAELNLSQMKSLNETLGVALISTGVNIGFSEGLTYDWSRIDDEEFEKLCYDIIYSHPGNDSNLLIVFYVQIMPDDFVMQLHR